MKNPFPHPRWSLIALTLIALGATFVPALAERAAITLDEGFDDWGLLSPVWTDGSGDGVNPLDLGRLWVADDADYLYLRFEVSGDLLLNGGNQLIIHLDTDNNILTGQPNNGIGADLLWKPGQKQGTFIATSQTTVYHDDVGWVALPTVTGRDFECAFRRDALPDGSHPLFPSSTIRIFLKDSIGGGDWLPNPGLTLTYTFDQGTPPPATAPRTLRREQASDLRVVNWNVLGDGLWNGTYQPKFRRMVQAINPDVINFQEIYDHSAAQTAALVQSWFPGSTWYGVQNNDCHTVSRYPILGSWPCDGNLFVQLDTTAPLGISTLVINVHLYCCTNDSGRQQEVDHILSVLRDAQQPGGTLTVPAGTAILFTGDTNFVGLAQQRTSILTGDIVDNATYGADFAPDWDGGTLTDLISLHTDLQTAYTWRSNSSPFWPGRLDYLVYNESAVQPGNHFILDPAELSADTLSAYGLLSGDGQGSDHLPVCVDLRGVAAAETSDSEPTIDRIEWSIMPNPSRGDALMSLRLPRPGTIEAQVFDPAGRFVADAIAGPRAAPAGEFHARWNARDPQGRLLAPGTYFVRVRVTDAAGISETTRRWVVIR